MLSGFWEEAEEPIARTEKQSFLGFAKDWEPKTKSLDFDPNLRWVLEETKALVAGKLKECEAISEL